MVVTLSSASAKVGIFRWCSVVDMAWPSTREKLVLCYSIAMYWSAFEACSTKCLLESGIADRRAGLECYYARNVGGVEQKNGVSPALRLFRGGDDAGRIRPHPRFAFGSAAATTAAA